MCGIVGAVAKRDVVPFLVDGLKRLEYRGYDSAGIAVLSGDLRRVRRTGRVAEMENAANEENLHGIITPKVRSQNRYWISGKIV